VCMHQGSMSIYMFDINVLRVNCTSHISPLLRYGTATIQEWVWPENRSWEVKLTDLKVEEQTWLFA
jgi:deoxyribodipyrimidine photolyase